MTVFLFSNNAVTTLAGPIALNSTTLNLAAGTGSLFPNPGVGQQFAMTLTSQSNANTREIVYCTARASDVCTVVRGQEGTAPLAWIANDIVDNYWTAGSAASMIQAPQLQQQATNYALDLGSVNNLVITLSPAPPSLPFLVGTLIRVKIGSTNTGAATLNVNGLGATTILGMDRNPLLAGALVIGHIQSFTFDGTNFLATDINAMGGDLTGFAPSPTLSSGAALRNLGFTPVQQGGGASQGADKIYLGYDGTDPRMQINNTDFGKVVMLPKFVRTTTTGYINEKLPDGTIIQALSGINSTGADIITFPNAFPTTCVQLVACEGAPAGWSSGTQPTIFGSQQIGSSNFALYITKWNGTAWALTGGISYRYIAIGY